MRKMTSIMIAVSLVLILAPVIRADENAAIQYWLAFTELDPQLPEYVGFATTDHKAHGFPTPLSLEQRDFLERESSHRLEYRFRKATSLASCNWGRDASIDGSAIHVEAINLHAHSLTRIILLNARREYEDGRWEKGNDYVIRTMLMARHVSGQFRPGENQCYMIENMARGTACAYLPEMPVNKRAKLADRIRQFPPLLPTHDAFYREAELAKSLSETMSVVAKDPKHRREDVTKLLRVFCSSPDADVLSTKYPIEQLQQFTKEYGRLQREIGNLINKPIAQSDMAFRKEIIPKFSANPIARLIHGDDDSNWLRREDAQSECRYAMFFAAIDVLNQGKAALAKHQDPFGALPFGMVETDGGFQLISELTYGDYSPTTKTWNHQITLAIGRTPPQNLEPK